MSRESDIKEGLRTSLRELLALHGVSGFEQRVVAYFRRRPLPAVLRYADR